MKVIRVHGPDDSVLPFDLRHFLALLAPRAGLASWKVSSVDAGYLWFDASGPGGDRLEEMMRAGKRVSGRDLIAAAGDTLQVIWGEFVASLPDQPDCDWLVIRAIGSTFYEIITNDEAVLGLIAASFPDVQQHELPWKAFSGDPE